MYYKTYLFTLQCNSENYEGKMALNTDIDTLYKDIRTRIYLTEYPPGSALREEELAEVFGVSRTPIRRVLHRLELEGLVISQRGIGTLVTTVDVKALKDVYALRLGLIKLVGELSSPRITHEHIEALERIKASVTRMRDSYDPKALALLYLDFHEQMMNLITNLPLRKIYDQLFHQTARVWLGILPELSWEEEVSVIHEEISEVIQALQADDMRAVADVRRDHLARVLKRINRYLSSADIW
jgi:DNA-binding GntR family transcriptional regulator